MDMRPSRKENIRVVVSVLSRAVRLQLDMSSNVDAKESAGVIVVCCAGQQEGLEIERMYHL